MPCLHALPSRPSRSQSLVVYSSSFVAMYTMSTDYFCWRLVDLSLNFFLSLLDFFLSHEVSYKNKTYLVLIMLITYSCMAVLRT